MKTESRSKESEYILYCNFYSFFYSMTTQNNLVLIGGLILIGWLSWYGISSKNSVPNDAPWTTVVSPQGDNNEGREVISVSHNGRSLVPNQILLEEGKDYDIQVTPTSNGIGCMFAATVPTLWSDVWNIKAGEPFTIKVDDAKVWTYPVICTSMGMKQWDLVVQPSTVWVAAPSNEYRLITVEAKRRAYTPSTIEIKQGEKIKIKIVDVDTVHGANFQWITATKDAEGNFIIDTSNTGTFDFSCANYCGEWHREMKWQIIIS